MSISINLVQRTDKINRNQTAPIHLRLIAGIFSRFKDGSPGSYDPCPIFESSKIPPHIPVNLKQESYVGLIERIGGKPFSNSCRRVSISRQIDDIRWDQTPSSHE